MVRSLADRTFQLSVGRVRLEVRREGELGAVVRFRAVVLRPLRSRFGIAAAHSAALVLVPELASEPRL